MLSALVSYPVRTGAYSGKPFTFLEGPAHEDIASILEIDLLENGPRAMRERWQERQLANVLSHAARTSPFWRRRIPGGPVSLQTLSSLPALTRDEVMEQVRTEGPLLDKASVTETYASTGSTGTPVKVHVAGFNGRYNLVRSLAQDLMEGRPLDVPRTHIKPGSPALMLDPAATLKVERHATWAGSLGQVFVNGPYRFIEFAYDVGALLAELRNEKVGNLTSPSSFMAMILDACGPGEFEALGITQWMHHADTLDPGVAHRVRQAGIPVRSNYSCAEVGPIATECAVCPGQYHVAHSNVIVECDRSDPTLIDGSEAGRILVTHLQGYATPLIRYDLGDIGALAETCACGHDGPTLSLLRGRRKFFLRHPDGRLIAFPSFTSALLKIVPCRELWIHQPDTETILAQFGGIDAISPRQEQEVTDYIRRAAGPGFAISVSGVPRIDWSRNPKRLPFTSAVA